MPNIVQSPGPVSAGGDQGSDFESFCIGQAVMDPVSAFESRSNKQVVFACTLRAKKHVAAKIRQDVEAIVAHADDVRTIYCFTSADVAKGLRQKLQSWAKQSHAIT